MNEIFHLQTLTGWCNILIAEREKAQRQREKGFTMATTNTATTNARALADMLAFAKENGWDNTAAVERLESHLASLERAAERKSGPSKSQRQNDILIDALVEYLASTGEALTVNDIAAWVTKNREEIAVCSVQKATALATRGCKTGRLTRATDGKKIVFSVAA